MSQIFAEHCVLLTDMGYGLLARLYFIKNDILNSSAKRQQKQNQSESSLCTEDLKYGFLDDPQMVKLLKKNEKTFPPFDPTILSEVSLLKSKYFTSAVYSYIL